MDKDSNKTKIKTKVLVCHTSGKFTTKGVEYTVINEDEFSYTIKDDYNNPHPFSKEPDIRGTSYQSYFYMKGEENSPKLLDRWEQLKQYIEDKIEYDYYSDLNTLQSILYAMEDIEQREKEEM